MIFDEVFAVLNIGSNTSTPGLTLKLVVGGFIAHPSAILRPKSALLDLIYPGVRLRTPHYQVKMRGTIVAAMVFPF